MFATEGGNKENLRCTELQTSFITWTTIHWNQMCKSAAQSKTTTEWQREAKYKPIDTFKFFVPCAANTKGNLV